MNGTVLSAGQAAMVLFGVFVGLAHGWLRRREPVGARAALGG